MKFETKLQKLNIDENEVKSIIGACECGEINGAYFIDLTKEKKQFIIEVVGHYLDDGSDEYDGWENCRRISTFCKIFGISEEEIPKYYVLGFNEGGEDIAYLLESNKDVILVLTSDERYNNSFIQNSSENIGFDEETGIQYEIMENKNEAGSYVPSFDKLFKEAPNGAMAMKWSDCQNRMAKRPSKFQGFAFNLVVLVQQKCGHYEILQHPFNPEYENITDVLKDFAEEGANRNCTRCICG